MAATKRSYAPVNKKIVQKKHNFIGLHRRRSIRVKGYDYSGHGVYFITICTHNKECLFGSVIKEKMALNQFGEIVNTEWLKTFEMRKNLVLDEYIIMPNHFHGIIIIVNDEKTMCGETACRGTLQRAPTFEQFGKPVSNSIPTIIRLFKSTTTKQINQLRNISGNSQSAWQRNYYEHIIRNENELNKIREYIQNNPLNWQQDRDNPEYTDF